MNRVTIVNLSGRAWHVESDGVVALEAWLADARHRLAADPDRDELVADFERAIADRFEAAAPDARDVVSTTRVTEILTALGTVEPAHDDDSSGADSATTTQIPSAEPADGDTIRERKLYRFGGDEAMLGGVCAGLAAYLRVDVTVVRVAVVLLTLLTSGALFLAYLVMWLIVPEAATPEERAHARGTGITAQEMLARARAEASPALTKLGSLFTQLFVVLGHITHWALLTAIWAIIAIWGVLLGWTLIDPDALLDAFDPGTSAWIAALWVTCIAWLPTSLLLAIDRGVLRALEPGRTRSRPVAIASSTAWIASVALAAIGTLAIPASHSSDLTSTLRDGRGEVRIFGQDVCVDSGPDRTGHCDDADISIIDDEPLRIDMSR